MDGGELAAVPLPPSGPFCDHWMRTRPTRTKRADRISLGSAGYQDLVNNAVGRQYAAMGYPESALLERVLTDPAIIRDREAVRRFNAAAYEKLKPAASR